METAIALQWHLHVIDHRSVATWTHMGMAQHIRYPAHSGLRRNAFVSVRRPSLPGSTPTHV
jgi:hypothetical protein